MVADEPRVGVIAGKLKARDWKLEIGNWKLEVGMMDIQPNLQFPISNFQFPAPSSRGLGKHPRKGPAPDAIRLLFL